MVAVGWDRKHPLHAQTREDVQNHLQQLEEILRCAHPEGRNVFLQGLAKPGLEAARMLMQVSKETEKEELREVETGLSCVQTVHGNYEGFT